MFLGVSWRYLRVIGVSRVVSALITDLVATTEWVRYPAIVNSQGLARRNSRLTGEKILPAG